MLHNDKSPNHHGPLHPRSQVSLYLQVPRLLARSRQGVTKVTATHKSSLKSNMAGSQSIMGGLQPKGTSETERLQWQTLFRPTLFSIRKCPQERFHHQYRHLPTTHLRGGLDVCIREIPT